MGIVHRSIIIGNGFDLFLGLKSSFADFIKSEEFEGISEQNTLKKFILIKKGKYPLWSDVENGLEEWSRIMANPFINEDDFGEIARVEFQPYAIDHFIEVRNALKAFISSISPSRIMQIGEAGKILEAWKRSTKLTFYNFNYTDTVRSYAKSIGIRIDDTNVFKHYYMHNNLNDPNIIFGSREYKSPDGFGFIHKSSSPNYQPPNFREIFSNSHEIDIFGHSFGNSDETYFKPFFEELLKSRTMKPLRIFCKNERSEMQLKSQIQKLTDYRLSQISQSGKEIKFFQMDSLFGDKLDELLKKEYPRR